MMSKGSSNSTNGRIVRPVTFFMEYLRRMRSTSAVFALTRSRRNIIWRRNGACETANAARDSASPVSSTVPSSRIILTDSIMR